MLFMIRNARSMTYNACIFNLYHLLFCSMLQWHFLTDQRVLSSCKLPQVVAENPFYILQQNQHIFLVARQVVRGM